MKKEIKKDNITLECEVVLYPTKVKYSLTLLIDEKRPLEVIRSHYNNKVEDKLILQYFSKEEIEKLKIEVWQSMEP